MAFSHLKEKLDKAELMVFFDLEATQIHHQAIAIGMIGYTKQSESLSLSPEECFRYSSYINTEEDIGPVVENLTGIHPSTLKERGKDFHTVVLEIAKILRPYRKRKFLSYGNLDISILNNTIDFHNETEANFFRNITKNYFDLFNYFSHFLIDEKGNALSLGALAKKFQIEEKGTPHDPFYDSLLLKDIYQCAIENEERFLSFTLEHYTKNRHMEKVNRALAEKILTNGKADQNDLRLLLKEEL